MKKLSTVLLSTIVCAALANAGTIKQEFEAPKDTSAFNGVEWGWNADLTFTYQALDQDFTPDGGTAVKLQPGLVLPTANLDINAKIMSGFNVKLETMLSSHHHNETYVKGGYASIDNLDFVSPGFASEFMKNATIKVGVDDIDYGDTHFRRTDNADVFNNPFIHNLAVDPYMAAGFLEVLYRIPSADSLVVFGATNGQVDPDDIEKTDDSSSTPAFYGKYAYDKQLNEDTRLRLSQSIYYTSGNGNNSLYHGDKAGTVSRDIYNTSTSNTYKTDFGQSWNAMDAYTELTATMSNVFFKYKDTELFGTLEFADSQDRKMTHYAVTALERFYNDKFYAAARYENATVKLDAGGADQELKQYQIGLGWFISKNAMAKVEYIKQKCDNVYRWSQHTTDPAEFDGFMVSAALSF